IAYLGMGGGAKNQPVLVVNNPPGPNPPVVMPPGGPAAPGVPAPGVPAPGGPVAPAPGGQVNLLQGVGTRVALANGQFRTSSHLVVTDPADPKDVRFRCKLYQIELQAGRTYQIDME